MRVFDNEYCFTSYLVIDAQLICFQTTLRSFLFQVIVEVEALDLYQRIEGHNIAIGFAAFPGIRSGGSKFCRYKPEFIVLFFLWHAAILPSNTPLDKT